MKNLSTALKDKTIEDLQSEVQTASSNLIEPTKALIAQVLEMLKDGKSYREIKLTVRDIKTEKRNRIVEKEREATRMIPNPEYNAETNPEVPQEIEETYTEKYEEEEQYDHQLYSRGLSYGQIKEIDLARQAKIAELTQSEEPAEL